MLLAIRISNEFNFSDKKNNYPASVAAWFKTDRIPNEHNSQVNNFVAENFGGERLKYASSCIKYDRHGYKPRDRFILLSNTALYVLDGKTYKQKHRLPLDKIDFVLTNNSDDLMVIRIPLELKKDKGDLILFIPHIIEFSTYIIDTVGTANIISIVGRDS